MIVPTEIFNDLFWLIFANRVLLSTISQLRFRFYSAFGNCRRTTLFGNADNRARERRKEEHISNSSTLCFLQKRMNDRTHRHHQKDAATYEHCDLRCTPNTRS